MIIIVMIMNNYCNTIKNNFNCIKCMNHNICHMNVGDYHGVSRLPYLRTTITYRYKFLWILKLVDLTGVKFNLFCN